MTAIVTFSSHCGHNQGLIVKQKRVYRCPKCDWWVSATDPAYRLALMELRAHSLPPKSNPISQK